MEKAKVVLWLMVSLYSFSVEAVSIIKNIKYTGNDETQPSVMNREIYIKEGDVVNEGLIEKSRQGIMNLGLFKKVTYTLEESENVQDESGNVFVDVEFNVKEKHYLLILPRARSNEDELHLGMQLRWDNVWGLNHEMRLLFENRGDTQGVSENRNSFRYAYPNIFDSRYSVNVQLDSLNSVDEADGLIDRHDDIYSLSILRWLNKDGKNRGWFVQGSMRYQDRFNEVLVGTQESEYIDAIVLGLDAGFSDINNYEFNRGGKSYGYELDWSHKSIGSDDEFTRHIFHYRSYYRFDDAPLSNLNVQTKFGHSNNKILGADAFSLGSSDDLRGYENNRFSGDTMFLMNIEYMMPHPEYPVIRYVYFIDMGSTTDEMKDIFHEPVNFGAGTGIRWKIKSLVNIDLRADIGYGFTDSDYRFSFGTRHAF